MTTYQDTPLRAFHRARQSRYRERILGVEPGKDAKGNPHGNLIPADLPDPTLNFLRLPELWAIAEERMLDPSGTVDRDRLRRNLLSSQPLCVNLYGAIKVHPAAGAEVLGTLLELDIARITDVRIEWAPSPASDYLDDRTAFDAIIEYQTSNGTPGFLAVETKYTEPFSRDPWCNPINPEAPDFDKLWAKREKYVAAAEATGAFVGDVHELFSPEASQLFRNALLALQYREELRKTNPDAEGHVIIAALEEDSHAQRAGSALRRHLAEERFVRLLWHETLADELQHHSELAEWAHRFRQRYFGNGL